MQVVMFLILLLLRMIVGVVALLLADLTIHFAPLLLSLLGSSTDRSGSSESNSDNWFETHIYHRWTGVWAFFILILMICASIDYVTGRLPWFAGLPVIAHALGCSAALLVITLVLTILGKSSEESMGYPFEMGLKSGPSFGGFNITLSEVFILSPLFVSEFLQDRLRTQR